MPAPPLPPGMDGFTLRLRGRGEVVAVSEADAKRLAGISETRLRTWVSRGTVKTHRHPQHGRLVLVESLWAAIPDAVKGVRA